MPELPEVETVRRVLKTQIINTKIIDIDIRYENIISDDIDYFKNNVIKKEIIDISRLGKFLIFNLNEGNIISHLRMEGKYFYLEKSDVNDKHAHVIFYLSNGYMLVYQDVRKFGRMCYKDNNSLYSTEPLSNVGVDLTLNNEYNILNIHSKITGRKTPIKTTLLDQSIIAGLGNIYVNEVLFEVGINPNRGSNLLTLEDVVNIIDKSKKIFDLAIINKGTTIKSYTSSLNVTGNYQKFLKVHTKSNCPNCKNTLIRVKINGRMTYFCENCQRS